MRYKKSILNKKRIIIISIILVIFVLLNLFFSRLFTLLEMPCINSAAINKNGDIALSYSFQNKENKSSNIIEVYDKYGNLKFQTELYASGGIVYDLYYDSDSILHAQTKNDMQDLYDEDGNHVGNAERITESRFNHWIEWNKDNNTYYMVYNEIKYCYEKCSIFDLNKKKNTFYIKEPDGKTIIIWNSDIDLYNTKDHSIN